MKNPIKIATSAVALGLLANAAHAQETMDRMVVLDRSAHMAGSSRMIAAQNATNLFIDLNRNSDGLGVVPYSTAAHTSFSLRRVTTVPNVRANAENFVDALFTGGQHSFADGLIDAISQLDVSTTGNDQCGIVLISSDEQSAAPYWGVVGASVAASGCPVHAVAQGELAEAMVLQEVAQATSGRFFYAEDADAAPNDVSYSNLSLANVLEHSLMRSSAWSRLLQARGAVPTFQSEFELPPDQIHTVMIDDTVDAATFTLDWMSINEPDCDNAAVSNGCFGKDLELRLVSPGGTMIIPNSIPYTFEDIVSGHVGFTISSPEVGEWTLVVNADSFYVWYDIPYQVIVSAETTIEPDFRAADGSNISPVTGDPVHVEIDLASHATLSNVEVVAEITEPGGTVTPLTLCDDGLHGDGAADDGLFAGQYARYNLTAPNVVDAGAHKVRGIVTAGGDIRRETLGAFAVEVGSSTTEPPAVDLLFAASFEPVVLAPGSACAAI